MGWLEKGSGSILFFFLSFVTWWLNEDFFSIIYFIRINFKTLGMENFHHKNLTKRNIYFLFKIERLICRTKKGKKTNFDFFVCLNSLCTW
jgi:uncharacterized membrane protein SirB2